MNAVEQLEAERWRLVSEAMAALEECLTRSREARYGWARWLWRRQARKWAKVARMAARA